MSALLPCDTARCALTGGACMYGCSEKGRAPRALFHTAVADAVSPATLHAAAAAGIDGLPSAGCKALVHALRSQRVPSVQELLLTLRLPMVRCDSGVPYAPSTPGYRCDSVCAYSAWERGGVALSTAVKQPPAHAALLYVNLLYGPCVCVVWGGGGLFRPTHAALPCTAAL